MVERASSDPMSHEQKNVIFWNLHDEIRAYQEAGSVIGSKRVDTAVSKNKHRARSIRWRDPQASV